MKIIAFYLPQFHSIPENNEWWGDGFTEWVNMKKAKPLFDGHRQPRIPLDENYYDLLNIDVMRWQTELAKKYGIYGFCFYHYWFDGHLLLEKPIENFLKETSLDFPFCLCWANEHWTNAWVSGENKVLIEQKYGEEKEWISHYNYLRAFFLDKRYIKHNNKPLIIIYRPDLIDCMERMMKIWNDCAIRDGFDGLEFAFQSPSYDLNHDKKADLFDYDIEYQPGYARTFMKSKIPTFIRWIYRKIVDFSYKIKINMKQPNVLRTYNYNDIWEYIIKTPPVSEKSVPCGFVDWDNTPRRGKRGSVFKGYSPTLLEKYMIQLIEKTKNVYKKDFMFFFAWNEWAEGGYLEPDEEMGYANLEAVRNALIATNELPDKND